MDQADEAREYARTAVGDDGIFLPEQLAYARSLVALAYAEGKRVGLNETLDILRAEAKASG